MSNEREEFDNWADNYGLQYEPNYCAHTDADVFAAWQACAEQKQRGIDELAAQVEVMREALQNVLPFVVTQVVACHGLKCREAVCESCSIDADAAAQKACDAYGEARQALSLTPSDALSEVKARALEEAAKYFSNYRRPVDDGLPMWADGYLHEMAAAIRKGE